MAETLGFRKDPEIKKDSSESKKAGILTTTAAAVSLLALSVIADNSKLPEDLTNELRITNSLEKPKEFSSKSKINTSGNGVSLNKDGQNISFTDKGSKFSVGDKNWQLDTSLLFDINSKAASDKTLSLSYRLLYAGAKLGTYIGIEKGSNLEKLVIAEGYAIEGGKLKLTGALLRRLVSTDFTEFQNGQKKDEKFTGKSIGLDFSKGFSKESILNEITTSISYFDVDGKDMGKIGNIIIDNATTFDQTDVYGAYRGGNKLLIEADAAWKLTENLKLNTKLGLERYNSEVKYDGTKVSTTRLSTGAGLTYQADTHNRAELYANKGNTYSDVGLKYTHNMGNGVELSAEAKKMYYENSPQMSQSVIGVQAKYSFGGKKSSKLRPLYTKYSDKASLGLSDLDPNSKVASSDFQVPLVKDTKNVHVINVDKTLAGVSLDKNLDGTLKDMKLETGKAISSIDSINYTEHLAYFAISGSSIVVSNFDKLYAPATYKLTLLNNDATYTLYEFTTTKGSVELKTGVTYINNATATEKDAYKNGTKTISQINSDRAAAAPAAAPEVVQVSSWQTISNINNVWDTSTTQTTLIPNIQSLINNYQAGSNISLELISSGGSSTSNIEIVGNTLKRIGSGALTNGDVNSDQTHTFRLKVTNPDNRSYYSNNFTVTIVNSY